MSPTTPLFPSNAVPPEARLAGLHILVVDDSPMMRILLTRILTAAGAVVTTHDGNQATLGQLNPRQFDVGLIDMDLGDATGDTVASELKDANGDLTLIAVSAAYPLPEAQVARFFAGFIPKPFTPASLVLRLLDLAQPKLSLARGLRTPNGFEIL